MQVRCNMPRWPLVSCGREPGHDGPCGLWTDGPTVPGFPPPVHITAPPVYEHHGPDEHSPIEHAYRPPAPAPLRNDEPPHCPGLPACHGAGYHGAGAGMPPGHMWWWRDSDHTSGYLAHMMNRNASFERAEWNAERAQRKASG